MFEFMTTGVVTSDPELTDGEVRFLFRCDSRAQTDGEPTPTWLEIRAKEESATGQMLAVKEVGAMLMLRGPGKTSDDGGYIMRPQVAVRMVPKETIQ